MNARQFADLLRRLPTVISAMDHTDTLRNLAEVVHSGVGENFARQEDMHGAVWPPRKDTLPHPLLILTGRMREAATGGTGAIRTIDRRRLVMGIDPAVVRYARRHQDGEPARRLPQRQYYFLHRSRRAGFRRVFVTATRQKFFTAIGRRLP